MRIETEIKWKNPRRETISNRNKQYEVHFSHLYNSRKLSSWKPSAIFCLGARTISHMKELFKKFITKHLQTHLKSGYKMASVLQTIIMTSDKSLYYILLFIMHMHTVLKY